MASGDSLNSAEENKNKNRIVAVMFIPYTPGSELARKLRQNEENFSKITQNKIKIIQRSAQNLLTC